MLSVAESAQVLNVSPARVRQLIAQGSLPAQKIGRAWVLREEDVMHRAANRPASGRPRSRYEMLSSEDTRHLQAPDKEAVNANQAFTKIYHACKKTCAAPPSAAEIAAIDNPEEAAFRIAIADFFLQRKQQELIEQGVF